MSQESRQNLRAGLASALVFILLYLVLEWSVMISLLLATGIFVGVYLINQPVRKIGDVELERIANGEELNQIYLQAQADIYRLQETAQAINHPQVSQEAQELGEIGQDIINYLEDNPIEISQSRHFLDYYLTTANQILDNFLTIKRANVSEDKQILITDRTLESLELLQNIFRKQRDGYHTDRLVELEVQTELLEKTIKLGGGGE